MQEFCPLMFSIAFFSDVRVSILLNDPSFLPREYTTIPFLPREYASYYLVYCYRTRMTFWPNVKQASNQQIIAVHDILIIQYFRTMVINRQDTQSTYNIQYFASHSGFACSMNILI